MKLFFWYKTHGALGSINETFQVSNGQPDGSFWIREKDAREMLQHNGSWVFSNVDGFPPRKINWTIGEVF